ncbi:hemolysin family protein [Sandaracinus amylolyticus]|uniref:hemolysin family protein n=1 Tax=Sandaracinus amylolyticus TaxID=927083 RepID=UPI0022A77E0C|nr:hemolysin family protein [Sandaracinus amylolyticus]
MPDSPEGPGLAATIIIVSALVGAVMSALTAAMYALPEELLMAVRDEEGPDAPTALRVLRERGAIRARLLTGRVMSAAALATATAYLVMGQMPLWAGVLVVAGAALGYAVVAEVAQTFARARARVLGLRLLRWSRPLEMLLAPLAWPIQVVASFAERLLPQRDEAVDEDLAAREVEHMIERREEEGVIPEEFAQLLLRVLEFKDTVAREVMVPRTRMVAIDVSTPIDDVVARVVEEGHSRYPVYRERVDRIEGILHAKDLFRAMREKKGRVNLLSIVRKPALFVAESQKIGHVLREMQSKRQHLALVVDEFGGTSGVVTLEDILEEIVGEIQDEHDAEESLVTEIGPNTFLADARVSIHELGELLDTELGEAAENAEVEVDSLGGLVVGLAGKVPEPGESVTLDGLDLIVREADEKHVTRVEIRRKTTAPPSSAEPAEGAV